MKRVFLVLMVSLTPFIVYAQAGAAAAAVVASSASASVNNKTEYSSVIIEYRNGKIESVSNVNFVQKIDDFVFIYFNNGEYTKIPTEALDRVEFCGRLVLYRVGMLFGLLIILFGLLIILFVVVLSWWLSLMVVHRHE